METQPSCQNQSFLVAIELCSCVFGMQDLSYKLNNNSYTRNKKGLEKLTLFSASTGASGKNFKSTDVFTSAAVNSAPLSISSSLQKDAWSQHRNLRCTTCIIIH